MVKRDQVSKHVSQLSFVCSSIESGLLLHWLNRLFFHSFFFVSSFIMCCHSQIMIFEATVTPDFFL